MPGTYSVQFDLTSVPSLPAICSTFANVGADDTIDSDGSEADGTTAQTTLISGQRDDTIDSGFFTLVTVGDRGGRTWMATGCRALVSRGCGCDGVSAR